MWHDTNEDSLAGGEEERRSGLVSLETWHVTNKDILPGGEEEGGAPERVGEHGNMACHKQGLTCWRGGRGRSGLVSLETWRNLCAAGTSVKLSCKKKSTTFHATWMTRRDVHWQWNKCPSVNNSTSFHFGLWTLLF